MVSFSIRSICSDQIFPAGGAWLDTTHGDVRSFGDYWSTTWDSSSYPLGITLYSGGAYLISNYRSYGYSIRSICSDQIFPAGGDWVGISLEYASINGIYWCTTYINVTDTIFIFFNSTSISSDSFSEPRLGFFHSLISFLFSSLRVTL